MIWATVSSLSHFCWLYRPSPSLTTKNMINLISVLTICWCPCVQSSTVLLEESVFNDHCVLLVSLIFLKGSLDFPILLFSSISLYSLLRKAFLSLLAIWKSAFKWVYLSFSPLPLASLQLFVRPPHITILPSCISFSLGWSWSLPPVQCHKPPSVVHEALYQN